MKNSKKIRSIRSILGFTLTIIMLWSLSFQSFASEAANTEPKKPEPQTDEALFSAFAVNPSTNENFDANDGKPAIITLNPEKDEVFSVNFHCKLPAVLEEDLSYHLLVVQSNGAIYIDYQDDMENFATSGFIFVSSGDDDNVKIEIDGASEILLNDQKMDLVFWEKLTTPGGYNGIIESGSDSISLVFTIKTITTDETQSIVPNEDSSSTESSSEAGKDNFGEDDGLSEESETEQHDLVDLTNDDIVLDLEFYQNSDKSDRAEIKEGETETTITLSNSANFSFNAKYYALPEFCNPIDCNTHIETSDDSFTIHFETALGEICSHTYKFQPSSSEVQGITLSYEVRTSDYKLNISNPFGGLSAEECLFGRRGIPDQVCYKAASITVRIVVKVAQPAKSTKPETNSTGQISAPNADPNEGMSITNSGKNGISIFIPFWLIKILLLVAAVILIYFVGKKQLIESRVVPIITKFFNINHHSDKKP